MGKKLTSSIPDNKIKEEIPQGWNIPLADPCYMYDPS